MLRKFPYGYYNENEFLDPEKDGVTITNIHIEAEGRFIFVDYSDGTNRVFDSRGNIILIHKNSEIKLLDFQYGDTNFFEIFDREASKYILYTVNNREENIISTSQQKFEYLDNAFISYDSYSTTIRDYNGNMLTIEKEGQKKMFFDNVTVYKDDTGYHYVVEVDTKYAIITSDLKQFGSWYSTMGELQRAWIGR